MQWNVVMAIIQERPRDELYIENSANYGHLTLLHCHFLNSVKIVMILMLFEILMLHIQDLVESYKKSWEESKILRVQGNRLKVTMLRILYELHFTLINGKS